MALNMKYSLQGEALTESFEGFSTVAYWDDMGKCWTIAFGHTRGVYKGMTCDRAQGVAWLHQDIAMAEANVNSELKVQVTQNEFDAMCDFDFNLGDNNFDHSTLLKLVNSGQIEQAAQEFEKWTYAGGKRVAGLLRRRLAERDLFLKGEQSAEA